MSLHTRRSFMGALAAAATVGALVGPAHAEPVLPSPAEQALWRTLSDVPLGEPFHGDWIVVDAYPPHAGGITLVIARGLDGAPMRIDVVRRDDPVLAPAHTAHLELYAMDGSDGDGTLACELVDAMQVLASRLGDERAQARLARRLLTHSERQTRFGDFMQRAAEELAPGPPGQSVGLD